MKNILGNEIHRIGDGPADIKGIYVHVTNTEEYDTIYVEYNSGQVKKMTKPYNMTHEEFLPHVKDYLVTAGANNYNKNKNWFLVKNNNKDVDLNTIEEKYQEQERIINKERRKRYRIIKARTIERAIIGKDKLDVRPSIISALATASLTFTAITTANTSYTTAHTIAKVAALIGVVVTTFALNKIRAQYMNIAKDEAAKLKLQDAIKWANHNPNMIEASGYELIEEKPKTR